jgi:outer membrane protein OmpA-like peptidoglycan-associated protein
MILLLVTLALHGGAAHASGPSPFAPTGSAHDGAGALTLWAPTTGGQGAAYVGLFGVDAETIDGADPLRRLAAAHLGLGWAPLARLRLEADLPYATSVVADGAVQAGFLSPRLAAVVPLRAAAADTVGFGVVPWIRAGLPASTLPAARPTEGGVRAVLGAGDPRAFTWRLNLGVAAQNGASALDLGGGFTAAVHPAVGLGAEVTARPSTADGPRPLEAHGVARFGADPHQVFTLAVGTGLSEGAGTPSLRVALGLSLSRDGTSADPDQDGILSDVDACPRTPEDIDGLGDADGCPELDHDGDGIEDTLDRCPAMPEDADGRADRDGCPEDDNDRDGIPDVEDACPLAWGPAPTQGCPDSDADGIPDGADACPQDAGPAATSGCPDRDGDGIPDGTDRCPSTPGDPARGDGCPGLAARRGSRIEIALPVLFDTNAATLAPGSTDLLLDVARVLHANPDIRLVEIAGHTDSDASDTYNRALSQRRAEAVRDFLVTRGGVAPDRLRARGYGEAVPIGDNATLAGRQTNRRVEFVIVSAGG